MYILIALRTSFATWCFSDGALWIDYTLITNLMHWLLFIHKILFSSTCFETQVLIFRRIQLYTCSIWYCHYLRGFVVACLYTAWVRTDCRGKVVGGCLKTPTNNLHVGIYHGRLVCRSLTCIPDGHLQRVIYTRWRIDKIDSPDDEHCVARSM